MRTPLYIVLGISVVVNVVLVGGLIAMASSNSASAEIAPRFHLVPQSQVSNVADLSSTVDDLSSRLDDLETGNGDNASTSVEDLSSRLDDLETGSGDNASTSVEDLSSRMDDVESRLDDVCSGTNYGC